MINPIKKKLYFSKVDKLMIKGLKEGTIVPFEDNIYNDMKNTYIHGLPVSIRIKYLKPNLPPGKCYDRSTYIFLCLDDALLVRGDNKDLELRFGKDNAGHGWVETEDYVYDPTLNMRFNKEVYYEMYEPTDVRRYTKDDYCKASDTNRKLYEDAKKVTPEDLKPYGRKRLELLEIIPLVQSIANMSENQKFISELDEYLKLIDYEEKEVYEELDEKLKQALKIKR